MKKLKNFVKKTLFGEKLQDALQNQTEVKKPVPPVEAEPIIPAPVQLQPEEKPIRDAKTEIIKTETKNFRKAETINDFLHIMERRFLESISPDNPVRIQLGIDLGTSFSKVVWRLGENSFPLCFGENPTNLENYLVPSTVAFGKKTLIWGAETPVEEPLFSLVNFKMCLACESEKSDSCNLKKCSLTKWNLNAFTPELSSDEAAFVNAFFLAKLVAESKRRIIIELEKRGFRQPFKVKWLANFSTPEKFIEKSAVSIAFERVFKISWLMAEIFLEKQALNSRIQIFECYLMAKDLLQELENSRKPFDCFLYSEIGAEVASILLSRTSEEGLYAFVDIGAGTVDASVFRFWRDGGETQRPPYSTGVFKLGAAHIESKANQKFSKSSLSWLKECKEKYVDLTENERGQLLKPVVFFLKEAAQDINKETYENLVEVFGEAFHKELGNEREDWQNLKLILGGGGAKLKTYQDAAIRAFTLKASKGSKPPETVILPKPTDFQMFSLPVTEFHRFAVAYGLSHEIVNLPEVIFSKDVAPMRQQSAQVKKNTDWYEK